jgi:hypothetical protein
MKLFRNKELSFLPVIYDIIIHLSICNICRQLSTLYFIINMLGLFTTGNWKQSRDHVTPSCIKSLKQNMKANTDHYLSPSDTQLLYSI